MRRKALTILFMFSLRMGFSQMQLVLNDDPYLVLNGGTAAAPVYLVIDNPSANAVTAFTPLINAGLRSENEFNLLKWNIGTAAGNYTVPFVKSAGTRLPCSLNITSPGTGAGHLLFSAYGGATWDNTAYMPAGVTNMTSAIGGANNSAKVIDRFWIIEPIGYATVPTATIDFNYVDAEWSAAGNTIAEGNLGAQSFNTGANFWEPITGTVNTAMNTVSGVPVGPATFFSAWTLADNSSPLPVELISFEAECNAQEVLITWSTTSETNNDFFTLEKSIEGISFVPVAIISGAGTSTEASNYSYSDAAVSGIVYYRLKQTDYNGESRYFSTVSSDCMAEGASLFAYNNQQGSIEIMIGASSSADYTVILFDGCGKKITQKRLYVEKGGGRFYFDISSLNTGIYFLAIHEGLKTITQKIPIGF